MRGLLHEEEEEEEEEEKGGGGGGITRKAWFVEVTSLCSTGTI
jgi:hypothetical protein